MLFNYIIFFLVCMYYRRFLCLCSVEILFKICVSLNNCFCQARWYVSGVPLREGSIGLEYLFTAMLFGWQYLGLYMIAFYWLRMNLFELCILLCWHEILILRMCMCWRYCCREKAELFSCLCEYESGHGIILFVKVF